MARYTLHPEERARRRAATALMTKCFCGNVASHGETTCSRCRDLNQRSEQTYLDITAEELGFAISEAFHDCNDIDGPHWPTVASKVAEAVGLVLSEAA